MHTNGQRISVVGSTGTGKTTVAREISIRLNLPHIELDALYWGKNWTGVPDDVFRARVTDAIRAERWVVDGNYSRIRALVWDRADTVVYLDYAFGRVLWQLITRTIRRSVRKEALWSGNQETLRKSFFSKDSILLWMLKSYHRRRNQYAKLFQQPENSHLWTMHLKTPQMTETWLSKLKSNVEDEYEC